MMGSRFIQALHLALYFYLQLFIFMLLNIIAVNNKVACAEGLGVESKIMVKDPAGQDAGYRITLSATVLEDGQDLEYKCVESGDKEDNRLSRLYEDGTVREIEINEHSKGSYTSKGCNFDADRFFVCTIVTGKVTWKKENGGKYCCSAAHEEWYYIHWINPVMHASDNHDLLSHQYGSTIDFPCSVEMTPTDISYEGILGVTWQWMGRKTGNSWIDLKLSNTVTSRIAPRGANATLTIRNFNPIQHGGDYRCIGKILRYKTLTSERFSIHSKPKATLKNNKRSLFIFGVDETDVKFTCQALSYPFPNKIEFKLQAAVLDEKTKGVTLYEADIVSINERFHKAVFTVNNMTEVFNNDSLLECRVFREDGEFAVSQMRISLTAKTPPIETTTMLDFTRAMGSTQPEKGGKTEPWVIAIAVIIAILVLLAIIGLVVWRWRKSRHNDSGGNSRYYQAPTNQLSRGYHTTSRNSLRSTRDPTYGYSSDYAQSKIHQNPIYGKSAPPSIGPYGETGPVYHTPTSLPRRPHAKGPAPRQPPAGSLPRTYSGGLPRQQNGSRHSLARSTRGEYSSPYAKPTQAPPPPPNYDE